MEAANSEYPTTTDYDTFARVLPQIRRLIALGEKLGRRWDCPTNVGEVAAATNLDPHEVVRLIRLCGYLICVEDRGRQAIERWIVLEDGE